MSWLKIGLSLVFLLDAWLLAKLNFGPLGWLASHLSACPQGQTDIHNNYSNLLWLKLVKWFIQSWIIYWLMMMMMEIIMLYAAFSLVQAWLATSWNECTILISSEVKLVPFYTNIPKKTNTKAGVKQEAHQRKDWKFFYWYTQHYLIAKINFT